MNVALLKINDFKLPFETIFKKCFLLVLLMAGFNITSFAQPSNDDPCNAIPITPDVVCNYQVFTNVDATATAGAPAPGCANYQGGDVWFQLVVPAASNGNLKFDTQAGGITDLGMAIYRGSCTNLQLIQCDDDGGTGLMSQITLTSLTVGSTIWVRCWEYGGNGNGTFGICVKYPGPPPAYDEPCTATALPNPTTTCSYTTFTDEGATASPNVPAPGCANYVGGDVWFTVTVPAGGILNFDTQAGEVLDGGMAIYSGTCTALTLIACDDNSSPNGQMPQIISAGLTPGSTIWIRIWSNVLTNNVGSFGLCVSIPPPPPANDEPCAAIPLTATSTCNYATYTTANATGTTGVPAPGCANYSGGDVWFKVVIPCDGKVIIDTQTGVMTDGGMAAYRGSCGNLQLIQCDDDGSANGLMPRLSLTSLTPGSTIYIRVWEFGNDNPGTFGICVTIPPPPPPGTSCFGGQPFCSSNTYTYNNSTNVPSLGSQGIYGCLFTTPNPAWYYMQLQTSGSLDIFIQQNGTGGNPLDVDFCLWGPFPTLASSCDNLAASNIVDCSYSAAATETANIANGQAGEFYILLITNYSNQPGSVTFNQSGGTGSTNCDIVCTLTSGNSGPICPGQTVNLTASTIVGATYQWNGPNCFNQNALSTQQNPAGVPVPTIPGQYVFWVTASFPGGSSCTSYDTVTVIAGPAFGLDTTINICAGNSQNLYAVFDTTGLTTAWTTFPAGIPVTTPDSVTVGGVYQLVGLTTSNCSDTVLITLVIDTVTLSINPVNPVICLGQSVTLTATSNSATVYSWSPVTGLSNPTNPVTVASPIQDSTTYVLTASLNSCSVQDSVTVYVEHATTGADTSLIICSGSTFDLTSIYNTTGFTTSWTILPGGATVPTPASVGAAGLYQLIATTPGGCTDTAVVTITVDVVNATVTST
ncbi:MAG: hypothetical protein H7258_12105, partial [Ferruginibacter sp.]|nr:hypothetical protein [Ferruginibacter sp.]